MTSSMNLNQTFQKLIPYFNLQMHEEYLVRDMRASGMARETAEGTNKPCKQKRNRELRTSHLVSGRGQIYTENKVLQLRNLSFKLSSFTAVKHIMLQD